LKAVKKIPYRQKPITQGKATSAPHHHTPSYQIRPTTPTQIRRNHHTPSQICRNHHQEEHTQIQKQNAYSPKNTTTEKPPPQVLKDHHQNHHHNTKTTHNLRKQHLREK
jgi:hypothetical protein